MLRTWHNVIPMSTETNRGETNAETKLLEAVEPYLAQLSDDEIAAKIEATEQILAQRRGEESRDASHPTRAAQRK